MKNERILKNDDITRLAARCAECIGTAGSKAEALKEISDCVSAELGEFFSPAILLTPNEMSVGFIEVLDQILFEIIESTGGDDRIREYLIEDLYARLCLYIDIYTDREIYKRNLCNRVITRDDSIIIRHSRMAEYIPQLMEEFFRQPELQLPVMRTLLSFQNDELLPFYYEVVKENYSREIKVLALIGLKGFEQKFGNWKCLAEEFAQSEGLIPYVRAFRTDRLEENQLPETADILFFVLQYVELNIAALMGTSSVQWIMQMLLHATTIFGNGSQQLLQAGIHRNVLGMLMYIDCPSLQVFLNDERNASSMIRLIDFLPREYFDRIAVKLSLLGDRFVNTTRRLVTSGMITPDERNSNILSFLFHETQNPL